MRISVVEPPPLLCQLLSLAKKGWDTSLFAAMETLFEQYSGLIFLDTTFTSPFSLYGHPSPEARWDSKGARPLAGPGRSLGLSEGAPREAAGGIP